MQPRRLWVLLGLLAWWTAAAAPPVAKASFAAGEGDDAPRELTYLGYLPSAEAPQVVVQTNEPTAAHLERIHPGHYRLHLARTAVLRHIWSLPLEASCFGGPIERVLATPQEEPDNGTAIELTLRRPGRVRLHAHGRNWFVTVLPDKRRPAAHPSRGKRHSGAP